MQLTVLAETGAKTFNLDVPAEIQATLVIRKCAWCRDSFVRLAPQTSSVGAVAFIP